MFKKLEGDTAMLRQGGVYRPCELYSWNGGQPTTNNWDQR